MHVDQDTLALLAMGEQDRAAQEHVRECARCQAEVDSLSAVGHLLVAAGPITSTPPPSHLWAGIEAAVRDDRSGDPGDELGVRRDRERETERPAPPEDKRRRFSPAMLLTAAAAGAVLALAGTQVLGDPDLSPPESTVLATAELDALSETVVPATAQILERDGQRVLRVDTGDLPTVQDGYLEVWLLTQDADGMVTVGLLESESGQQDFVLPESLSTQTFGVVDVSVEHYDGDPTHSGESLWRGPLS